MLYIFVYVYAIHVRNYACYMCCVYVIHVCNHVCNVCFVYIIHVCHNCFASAIDVEFFPFFQMPNVVTHLSPRPRPLNLELDGRQIHNVYIFIYTYIHVGAFTSLAPKIARNWKEPHAYCFVTLSRTQCICASFLHLKCLSQYALQKLDQQRVD